MQIVLRNKPDKIKNFTEIELSYFKRSQYNSTKRNSQNNPILSHSTQQRETAKIIRYWVIAKSQNMQNVLSERPNRQCTQGFDQFVIIEETKFWLLIKG